MTNNIEIGILNIVASIILFISCVTIAIYYYKADVDKSHFNMTNLGLMMCIWTLIILGLMGINLIRG